MFYRPETNCKSYNAQLNQRWCNEDHSWQFGSYCFRIFQGPRQMPSDDGHAGTGRTNQETKQSQGNRKSHRVKVASINVIEANKRFRYLKKIFGTRQRLWFRCCVFCISPPTDLSGNRPTNRPVG